MSNVWHHLYVDLVAEDMLASRYIFEQAELL